MVDTASDATLMKRSVYNRLDLPPLTRPRVNLTGVMQTILPIQGETTAVFHVSNDCILTHRVSVLDDYYLSSDILLGMDLIARCGPVTVDPKERKVTWGKYVFPSHILSPEANLKGVSKVKRVMRVSKVSQKVNAQNHPFMNLHVSHKLDLPPRQCNLVTVRVPKATGKEVILKLSHPDVFNPLPIFSTVTSDGILTLPMINETSKRRHLKVGTMLGTLEILENGASSTQVEKVEVVSPTSQTVCDSHSVLLDEAPENGLTFQKECDCRQTKVVRHVSNADSQPHISNAMLPEILERSDENLPRIDRLKALVNKQDLKHLTRDQRARLKKLLLNFEELFILSSHDIGTIQVPPQEIPVANPTPVRGPQYRHPEKAVTIIQNMMEEMRNKDIIESSSAAWLSPIVLVAKPDGSRRLCLDYRKVNQHLKLDIYPLPRLDELVESTAGHQFYCTLDLKDAYYQVVLDEASRDLTTFSDGYELWRFKRLPFGLSVSPAIFTRVINQVIAPLAKQGFVRNYLDDVIVFASSYEQLLDNIRAVFERFNEMGVKLNMDKCSWAQRSVKFLGHIISSDGIKPDPANVEGILQVPPPTNLKEVRRFLGMTGFYRKNVPGYATIANPLTHLTRKDVAFVWTPECQKAFEKLKSVLASAPILHPVDFTLPFELHSDASGLAVGAALHQRYPDGSLRPLGYFSKKLRPVETRYSTTDKEALGIVLACRFFHHFLWGSKVTIKTDHQALTSVFKRKTKSPRMTRWALEMRDYQYEIEFKPGRANVVADQLSRCVRQVRVETINEEFQSQIDKLHAPLAEIAKEQDKEERWRSLKLYLQGGALPKHKYARTLLSQFELVENTLFYVRKLSDNTLKFCLVVPNSLKKAALHASHDDTAGHMGQHKTITRAENDFYWPGYRQDCKRYVDSCEICQQYKSGSGLQQKWQSFPEVSRPLERVSVDLTDMHTSTSGHRFVLSIIDHYSRFVSFSELKTKTASEVSQRFTDYFYTYGTPKQLLADNGAEFNNELFRKICHDNRIKLNFVTPYHPEGNAVTERVHKSFKTCLGIMTQGYPNSWPRYLKKAQYALNTSVHTSTGVQPHFAFFSNHVSSATWPQIEDESGEGLSNAHRLIRETNAKMSAKFREVANSKRKNESVKVNDLVWVRSEKTIPGTARKLNPKWYGPYTVVEVIRNGSAYKLANPFEDAPLIRRAADKVKRYIGRAQLLTQIDAEYDDRHDEDDSGLNMDNEMDCESTNEVTGTSSPEEGLNHSTNENAQISSRDDPADSGKRYPVRQRNPVDRLQYAQ